MDYRLRTGFSGGSDSKNSPANARHSRDVAFILGLERSLGEGNDYPLQYSCLENSWIEEPGGLQCMGLQRVGHN